MIIKLYILGFLNSAAMQEILSNPVEATINSPEKEEKTCNEKVECYRNTTAKTKELLDTYKKLMKEHPLDNHIAYDVNTAQDKIEHVEKKVKKFKQKVADAMNKYLKGTNDMAGMSNTTARLAFCREELKWSDLWNKNLITMATDIEKHVTDLFKLSDVQKSSDKTRSRIVNFLFIIDMTENIFKDVKSLDAECFKKTDEGIALAETRHIREDGELAKSEQEISEDYKEALEDNEVDRALKDALSKLEDDSDIRAAEARAMKRKTIYDVIKQYISIN